MFFKMLRIRLIIKDKKIRKGRLKEINKRKIK